MGASPNPYYVVWIIRSKLAYWAYKGSCLSSPVPVIRCTIISLRRVKLRVLPHLEQFPIPTGELHYFWLDGPSFYQGQHCYFAIMLPFVFIPAMSKIKSALWLQLSLPTYVYVRLWYNLYYKTCEDTSWKAANSNALPTKQNGLFPPQETDQ